jgi:hypothetical protein
MHTNSSARTTSISKIRVLNSPILFFNSIRSVFLFGFYFHIKVGHFAIGGKVIYT